MKAVLMMSVLLGLSFGMNAKAFASESSCNFIVASNSGYRMGQRLLGTYYIDPYAESILIGQGKEVTRSNNVADLKIFITYSSIYKETLIRDILGLHEAETNKRLTIEVEKNNGVVVYRKTITGTDSDSNKEELLESLTERNFQCNN